MKKHPLCHKIFLWAFSVTLSPNKTVFSLYVVVWLSSQCLLRAGQIQCSHTSFFSVRLLNLLVFSPLSLLGNTHPSFTQSAVAKTHLTTISVHFSSEQRGTESDISSSGWLIICGDCLPTSCVCILSAFHQCDG